METQTSEYCMRTTVEGTLGEAIEMVKAAFKEEGFGCLFDLDIRQTLADKIGEQIEPYTVLGMCNPRLAARAIRAEHEIGVLLPCNVLVHECGGRVNVAAQDPGILSKLVGSAGVAEVATEARTGIAKALARLSG